MIAPRSAASSAAMQPPDDRAKLVVRSDFKRTGEHGTGAA
jgi:hypothetical protein